ncbi:MAG: hypothetical protein Fues2KO_01430 [Fuerstiella sp.]
MPDQATRSATINTDNAGTASLRSLSPAYTAPIAKHHFVSRQRAKRCSGNGNHAASRHDQATQTEKVHDQTCRDRVAALLVAGLP